MRGSRPKNLVEHFAFAMPGVQVVRCRDCRARYILRGNRAWRRRPATGVGLVAVLMVLGCALVAGTLWMAKDLGASPERVRVNMR